MLDYIAAMTVLGHILMEGIALSLGLNPSYFADRYTQDPLILFRIFNYPPDTAPLDEKPRWGVGEHTDYGVLTILKQDDSGGLEVQGRSGWMEALPIPGTFVCNLGDMLDRMTGGWYRSTPHRVRNPTGRNRLSCPFFFDPQLLRQSAAHRFEHGSDRRQTRTLGRGERPRILRHLWRVFTGQGLQGFSGAGADGVVRGASER